MFRIIYLIILAYFLLGGLAFFLINRKKPGKEKRLAWRKYLTYVAVIHLVFFSIISEPWFFPWLAWLIAVAGLIELFVVRHRSRLAPKLFFRLFLAVYLLLAAGLIYFAGMDRELVLFVFLICSVFDAFSQISGQLFGHTLLVPRISPKKTLEGLLGGAFVTLLSALLLQGLAGTTPFQSVVLGSGILIFAFLGDLWFSWFKRKHQVKDYNRLLPGHGGILDRFDSLIAGAAFLALIRLAGIF